MTTDANLPPHLQEIGRQLTAAADGLRASKKPAGRVSARYLVAAGPAFALAAVAAIMVAVAQFGGGQPGHPTNVTIPGRGHGTKAHPQLAPIVHPTAAKVLHRAAFVALQASPTTPGPDQFVYTKTQDGTGQITQSWMSVDGTRTSIIDQHGNTAPTKLQGCVDGRVSGREPGKDGKPLSDFLPAADAAKPLTPEAVKRLFGGTIPMDGPITTSRCTPQPAFFPDMPTNAGSMLAYLEKIQIAYPAAVTSPGIELNNLAKNVGFMLGTDYLLPAQQAALYQFLATTPGITLAQSVKDVAGRPGIGVQWSFEGSSAMLIFDPTTYQYLGLSTTGTNRETNGEALLQTAIVDTAGQQPARAQQAPTRQNQA